jgi:hypothetical protein
MKDHQNFIFLFIVSFIIYGTIIYLSIEDEKVCDELVTFQDGTQIEATTVKSYNNGMTNIKLCTGEILRTPSLNIKTIEELKK